MKLPERIELANRPTPIQKLERLSQKVGKNIWLWRDDLTGFVEAGNKIRKLEFILSDALSKGAKRVVTCGGPQSNHARATVFLARKLGLNASVVVREPKEGLDHNAAPSGNLLLNKMAGADFKFVPFETYQNAGGMYDSFLAEEADKWNAKGEKSQVIYEGGSEPLGCFGYHAATEELISTWKSMGPGSNAPSSLFLALGSGGTHAGLHLGFQEQGLPTDNLYAVNVCDSEEYFQNRVGNLIDRTIEDFNLPQKRQSLQIFDGHFGEGYGMASDDDLRFYMDLCRDEGVLLDPVYTGKGFQGMLREIDKDPKRFGDDVVFLHSGGAFAHFAYADRYQRLFK